MEKISWTNHVRNEEVLLGVNEQRNILHEIRKRKANWIGHVLRRNCLLKQVIKGKIKGEMELTRRRGRRRKKLLDELKERKGYCHLKEEVLDRTVWRNRFGGGLNLSSDRILNEWMNERIYRKWKWTSCTDTLFLLIPFLIFCFQEAPKLWMFSAVNLLFCTSSTISEMSIQSSRLNFQHHTPFLQYRGLSFFLYFPSYSLRRTTYWPWCPWCRRKNK